MLSAQSMTHVLLVICLGTTVSLAQAQATPSNAKPEDQVTQLEHEWLAADAIGNAVRLRQIIADDFIGSSVNGTLLNKDDIIPEGTGPGGFAGATAGEANIRVFGDTAVLMGLIISAGQPQAKQIHVTLVCQKKPQGWQIIAAQLTRM
jgi:ketosteroid isomerase-like protein